MNNNHKTQRTAFRDQLLAVETLSEDSQKQMQQELRTMFIRELSAPRRFFFGVVAAFAFVSGAVCAFLALTEPNLPALARTGLGVGSLFGFAWTAVAARISCRGAVDVKIDNRRIAAMVWIFNVLMMVFFMMVGMSMNDGLRGLMMIANGLAFLIGAAVYWLNYRIGHAQLSLQEKLLRIELRLAELSENREQRSENEDSA